MRLAPLLAVLLAAASARAQPVPGTCALGRAEAVLDPGDAAATLFNTGALFFGNTTTDGSGYLVPKDTGRSPIFAAGLWLGGKVGGELRMAAATYSSFNFWPGPLGPDGRPVNPADCSAYDRIYSVTRADILAYEAGGAPSTDLAE
jgi:hypothetical protein